MNPSVSQLHCHFFFFLVPPCLYLHSVVLNVVISNGLQERLCVVAEGYSLGVEFGFVWSGCTQRAAVVFILLFIVVVVNLTGLQASREYGGLKPFCGKIGKLPYKFVQNKIASFGKRHL